MAHDLSATDLTYNIVEELLTGAIDGTSICARVVSGGRAGSRTPGAVNPFLANNPYATRVKLSTKTAGGPAILGTYTLRTHEDRKRRPDWIRLIPSAANHMHGRAGFAIHGRGPRGSDGCLVPTDSAITKLLYKLVVARERAGKAAPTLTVLAIGDLDFIEKRLDTLNRTV